MPALLFVFAFSYLPMFGLVMAFQNYTYSGGIFGSDWAGFKNFEFFFNSQDAFRVTRNTILMNAACIILGLAASVVCGLLLAEMGKRAVRFFQTILFFPYFLSWVVVGYLTYILLNPSYGVINHVLESFHFTGIDWYSDPKYWPYILILTYLWKNVGYTAIIFFTGLMSIDPSYYEAAQIDGASRFQQIMRISIPLLMPLILLLFMLNVGRIFFSDFGMFYFVPQNAGALYSVTDVIDTYVYRSLRVVGDIGMATAVGLYQSVVGFILVLFTNYIVKRVNPDSSMF
nr:ABC transporter permease subunit [Paenibacillus lignilyticus]